MDLEDLHALVPAAQEEDLLEQVARERVEAESAAYDAELRRAGNPLTGEPAEPGAAAEPGEPSEPGEPGVGGEPAQPWEDGGPWEPAPGTAAEGDPADEPPMRTGQVLGLVEHVLGARVLDVHRPVPRPRNVGPRREDVP